MNLPSSLPKYKHKLATSLGSVKRPRGTLPRKFFTFSGVCSTPTKVENRPVPESSGQSALTLIWSFPNSAARPFVAWANASAQKSHTTLLRLIRCETHICNSSLARVVPDQARSWSHGPDTCDVYNGSSTSSFQSRDRDIDAMVDRFDIDVHYTIELVFRHLEGWFVPIGCASIVDLEERLIHNRCLKPSHVRECQDLRTFQRQYQPASSNPIPM